MKFRIKLLKAWTDPSGQEFKAGDIVEIDDKTLAGELLTDGIGEKAAPAKDGASEAELMAKVKSVVSDAIAEAQKNAPHSGQVVSIEVKDLSDDDPGHSYLPQKNDDKWSKGELEYGFGEFAKDVAGAASNNGQIPERLMKSRERSVNTIKEAIAKGYIDKAAGDGMTAGTPSEGGFTIPPEFSLQLLDSSDLQAAAVRPRATRVTIGTNRIALPMIQNYDHSSNLVYGGVAAYWKAEEAQLTEVKAKTEELALTLHKLTAFAYASGELLKFSGVTLGSWLLPKLSEAIAWKEDDGFINGTGAGMPLGIQNAPSKVDVAIEDGQTLAGSAVVTDNLTKMYARCRIKNSGKTIWLYNKNDAFPWLASLSIDVGTGGSAAGLIQRVPGRPDMDLLGIPLVDNEHMAALGTVGDIVLTDLGQYIVADDRSGPSIATSMHLKFDYDQMAYRILKYVDGRPMWSKVFTRQKASTNTEAPIVRLAARS